MTAVSVTQVGSVVASFVHSLRLDGDTAYVSGGQRNVDGQLSIVNATDLTAMTVLGSIGLLGATAPSERVGDIVCLFSHEFEKYHLRCVNVANPAAPTLSGSLQFPGTLAVKNSCVRIGNHAYGSGNTLTSINVTNPASPTLVQEISTFGGFSRYPLNIGSNRLALGINGVSPERFAIADVANPAAMTILGSVPLGTPNTPGQLAKHPTANIVYVPCQGSSTAGVGGLVAVDITTPSAPTVAYTENISGDWRACSVTPDGTTLVLAGPLRIRLYDITSPSAPVFVYAYHRDDQPAPNNKNIFDGNGPQGMGIKSDGLSVVTVGDLGKVVGFTLTAPAAPVGGWRLGT